MKILEFHPYRDIIALIIAKEGREERARFSQSLKFVRLSPDSQPTL